VGTIHLRTGRNVSGYDEAPDPNIVFTATGDGSGPYVATLQLDSYRNRFGILNAGLAIQGSLSVTNVGTTAAGTTYPVLWDSSARQFIRSTSSRRYKENIQPLGDDAYRILKLEPKRYTRRDGSQKWEVGYLAEDLDRVGLKEVTMYDEEGRPDAIDYAKIVLYSNEIIKNQQARLQTQQRQLDALQREVEELKRLVSNLKPDRQ
jgi:hypothetical protein